MAQPIGTTEVLTALFSLALVLVAVYYTTKYVARKASGNTAFARKKGSRGSGAFFRKNIHRQISVLDRVNITKEKALLVIAYQDKQYLLGVGEREISVLEKGAYTPPPEPEEPENTNHPSYPDNFITRWIFKQNVKKDNIPKNFDDVLKDTQEKDGGDP